MGVGFYVSIGYNFSADPPWEEVVDQMAWIVKDLNPSDHAGTVAFWTEFYECCKHFKEDPEGAWIQGNFNGCENDDNHNKPYLYHICTGGDPERTAHETWCRACVIRLLKWALTRGFNLDISTH